MKVDSGYRFSKDWIATASVERVYKGKSATELTMGLRHNLPIWQGLTLDGYMISGYGKGYGVKGELKLSTSFSVFLGTNYDVLKSLQGERNIVSLKRGDSCWSAFSGIRFYY